MTDIILQMIFALMFVGGIIALLGLVLKKNQSRDGLMKVLEYKSLGQKKGIAVVQVGKETLLLAVTPTDIKLLKTLNEPAEEPAAAETQEKAQTMDFSDKLKKLKALKETLYAVK